MIRLVHKTTSRHITLCDPYFWAELLFLAEELLVPQVTELATANDVKLLSLSA